MYTAVVLNYCRFNLKRGGRQRLWCYCQMVVHCIYVSYMAQMTVDSTSHEFKHGTSGIFNFFVAKTLRIHVSNVTNTTNVVSLEIGDKMLCSTHIHNSIL